MRAALPLALAALILTACGQPAPAPADPVETAEPVETADIPPAEPQAPLFDAAALGIPDDPDSIADGRTIAVSHCAVCHGIDAEDGFRTDAPPLRHVLSYYPPESLSEDFRAGIHIGHEDMPGFVFGDLGMDVLLAYLVTIQERPPAQP